MDYLTFGPTGLKVSELCLGAMTFGRESSEADSAAMMDRYVEAGGNFIDTANVYGPESSEQIVGRWLGGRTRHDLVIATKARFPMGEGPNDVGVSRKALLHEVEQSLRRLGTDYIDLYQVHAWDDQTPLEETLSTLDLLVRSGKIRYAGVSNHSGWQLQKALDLSRERGWTSYVSLQAKYNLMVRETEWELLPVCRNEGLAVMVWGPLFGGWLSGRYRRGMAEPKDDSRIAEAQRQGWFESWANYANERTWSLLDVLFAVADEAGRSPAQVALHWLRRQSGTIIPILGVRTMAHLEDNLGSVEFRLSDDQLRRLDEASAPRRPYPYDFLDMAAGRR